MKYGTAIESIPAAVVYGLTDENDLISFDSANPTDLLSARAISGLADAEALVDRAKDIGRHAERILSAKYN